MEEFAVTLDSEKKKPLYEQIYEAIREAILGGRIACGEKLPSTRFEAEFLACSRSTVELAYEQLLSEGYIESKPYRGYYACDVRDLYHLTNAGSRETSPVQSAQKEQGKYRVDFSPNGIELSPFPYVAMGKIMKNLMLYEGEHLLQSGAPFGEENLRQAICDYLYQSRSVRCAPEQIVLGAGNEYLQVLFAQVLGGGHRVALESPTYLKAYRTFHNLGYPIEEIPMDRDGMRTDILARTDADLVYVMPSHQFPMGNVMPMKRRLELLKWADAGEGRYIIEDDYDSEFRYKGKPIPALQGLDRMGRVLYFGTFSRSIAPAMRVSYMVLPMRLLEPFRKVCGFYACSVSGVMQQSIYHFMKEGYFEKNLNRMRGVYKAKHDFLLGELKKCVWAANIQGENSGLHLVVETKTELTEQELIDRCKKQGVRVYGLSEYCPGGTAGSGTPVLLLGYGGLSEVQISDGLHVISEII